MLKKIFAAMLSVFLIFSLCSCDVAQEENDPPEQEDISVSEEILEEPRFTVTFDKNEAFPDEISKRAAKIIDPSIEVAVKMLNTIPEYGYNVLECDYSERRTEKDDLTDETAVYWYGFIYEKMSNLEDFRLYPEENGGEEFYLSFYTAESALMTDHREIFLCGATWMDEEDGSIFPIYFMPGEWLDNPCSDKEAIKSEAAVYDRIVERIFEKMPAGLDNYQKVCYFAFVTVAAAEYDHSYEDHASVYTPYDTLVLGKTVCRGYAMTFYELCRRAGISCRYCEGMVPSGFHAWNKIDTAEGSFWIDLTGYDNENIAGNYNEGDTEYLFMTEKEIDEREYREGIFE